MCLVHLHFKHNTCVWAGIYFIAWVRDSTGPPSLNDEKVWNLSWYRLCGIWLHLTKCRRTTGDRLIRYCRRLKKKQTVFLEFHLVHLLNFRSLKAQYAYARQSSAVLRTTWRPRWNLRTSTPVKFKPHCRSAWNVCTVDDVGRVSEVPSLVLIRPLGAARHAREITASGTFLVKFSFFVCHRPNYSTDFHDWRLKRRGMTQENAFRESHCSYIFPKISKKPFLWNYQKEMKMSSNL